MLDTVEDTPQRGELNDRAARVRPPPLPPRADDVPCRDARHVAGSELLQPLAICVIGGLLFALVVTLMVTPAVYAMIRRPQQIR
jgi:hypothetical protein